MIDILSLIPFGKDNAVDRYQLSNLTGLCERDVREAIRKQSSTNNPVINTGSGYYRPTKDDYFDVKKYMAQEEKRAASIEQKIKSLKQYLIDNDPDQLSLGRG